MAIQNGPLQGQGSFATQATHDTFIPELWMPEIKRFLDQQFMMTEFLDKVPDQFRNGKLIHMPTVGRLRTEQKVPETALNLQAPGTGEFTMTLNYRPWVAVGVEDVLEIQSAYPVMSEYSREAAYALAQDIDRWVLGLRPALVKAGQVIQSETSGGGNAPLNRAALLAAKLKMDKANVPVQDRVWVFSPSQHISLLTIPEFTSKDYVSGSPTESGVVGMLYGSPVRINNNITKNSIDGIDLNANIIGATPDLVPTPGFAKNDGSSDVYSPFWPNPTYNGNENGAGNHADVDINHTLTEGAYTGMLVRKGFAKYWQPEGIKVETDRLVLYQTDALVTGIPLYGNKVFREEFCVLIESFETA